MPQFWLDFAAQRLAPLQPHKQTESAEDKRRAPPSSPEWGVARLIFCESVLLFQIVGLAHQLNFLYPKRSLPRLLARGTTRIARIIGSLELDSVVFALRR